MRHPPPAVTPQAPGRTPHRFALRLPGAEPDPAALQEHVRGHLAGYKVPRSVWLTGTIRRTVSGKADYAWAREYAGAHEPALNQGTR